MNLLSFIATITLTITMMEGLYILSRDFRSESNRLFFYICLCIAIWLFGGLFGYSSLTRDEAFFWLKITSPGFIFMHAFVLHFILRYTNIIQSGWINLLYLPSLAFLYIGMTDHLVFSDIYRSGKYWAMVPDYDSITFYLFMINYLSYYILSLILLFIKMKRTGSIREYNQGRIIFIAIVITIASYNIEPFLIPLFFDYHTYGQAPIYSIVWISFIWYAMNKYRFLEIYKQFIPFDVIDSLNEMVVIIDYKKEVIKINKALQEKLGFNNAPLSLKKIFVEHELIERLLDSPVESTLSDLTLNIRISKEETDAQKGSISVFRDRFGDIMGFIITVRDISGVYSFFEKTGITSRELQLIQLIIAGNTNKQIAQALGIKLRTVETHITNIFTKLGLKRRSELINYCTDLFSTPSGN